MNSQEAPGVENSLPVDRRGTKKDVIENAVSRGVTRYISTRENKVPHFVKCHYSFRGALKIHAHAFGWDLVRVPVNIIWSLVNLVLALIGLIAKIVRLKRISQYIKKIPPGIETDMDKQIKWLVITELLELPYTDGSKKSDQDALMDEIMKDPDLRGLIDEQLQSVKGAQDKPEFWQNLERKLAEYGATRTGAADLASNIMVIFCSKLVLGQTAYGTLSAGSAVSVSLAQSIAVSNFWLGSAAGSYYYAFVPVVVSLRFLIAITAVIAIVLAFVSTFIGIITDPIQAKLGIHQKRLCKFIKAMQRDLEEEGEGEFQLREKYVGRVFDIVDFLAVLGRTI
jgi:hypothetical protein